LEAEKDVLGEIDPNESPFATPPITSLPAPKDSEEARAIDAIIEEAERERSAGSGSEWPARRDSSKA
jgi:hypothetical protein